VKTFLFRRSAKAVIWSLGHVNNFGAGMRHSPAMPARDAAASVPAGQKSPALAATAADLAQRRAASQSKRRAEALRLAQLGHTLEAWDKGVSWSQGQVDVLRREAAALHAAYREQLLRNEELECSAATAEHDWQRRLNECLEEQRAASEDQLDALRALLRDGMLEAQAQITAKDAALTEVAGAAQRTVAALEAQLAESKEGYVSRPCNRLVYMYTRTPLYTYTHTPLCTCTHTHMCV